MYGSLRIGYILRMAGSAFAKIYRILKENSIQIIIGVIVIILGAVILRVIYKNDSSTVPSKDALRNEGDDMVVDNSAKMGKQTALGEWTIIVEGDAYFYQSGVPGVPVEPTPINKARGGKVRPQKSINGDALGHNFVPNVKLQDLVRLTEEWLEEKSADYPY